MQIMIIVIEMIIYKTPTKPVGIVGDALAADSIDVMTRSFQYYV